MPARIDLDVYPIARTVDADPRIYCPGEPIAGHVRIDPLGDTRARRVLLTVSWRTEGRGDKDKGVAHRETLHEGNLPTQPMEFDFSVPAPASPWSYAGTLLHIHWSVEVRIDIPFGKDTIAARRFLLVPEPRLHLAVAPAEPDATTDPGETREDALE